MASKKIQKSSRSLMAARPRRRLGQAPGFYYAIDPVTQDRHTKQNRARRRQNVGFFLSSAGKEIVAEQRRIAKLKQRAARRKHRAST